MPVQTAYAGPTSSRLSPRFSSPKLVSAKMQNITVGHSLVKPCDSFRKTANPVSRNPATTTRNQAKAIWNALPLVLHVCVSMHRVRGAGRSIPFTPFARRQQPTQRVQPGGVRVPVGDPLVQGAVRLVVAARPRALRGARPQVGEGVDDARRVDMVQ